MVRKKKKYQQLLSLLYFIQSLVELLVHPLIICTLLYELFWYNSRPTHLLFEASLLFFSWKFKYKKLSWLIWSSLSSELFMNFLSSSFITTLLQTFIYQFLIFPHKLAFPYKLSKWIFILQHTHTSLPHLILHLILQYIYNPAIFIQFHYYWDSFIFFQF